VATLGVIARLLGHAAGTLVTLTLAIRQAGHGRGGPQPHSPANQGDHLASPSERSGRLAGSCIQIVPRIGRRLRVVFVQAPRCVVVWRMAVDRTAGKQLRVGLAGADGSRPVPLARSNDRAPAAWATGVRAHWERPPKPGPDRMESTRHDEQARGSWAHLHM
jgi:hypothetical protein